MKIFSVKVVSLCLITIPIISGCVSSSKYKTLENKFSKTLKENNRLENENKIKEDKIIAIGKEFDIEKEKFEDERIDQKEHFEEKLSGKIKQEELLRNMVNSLKDEITNNSQKIRKIIKGDLLGKLFFPSGSAELTPKSISTIDSIAPTLQKTKGTIKIIGHTDNLPPNSELKKIYISNWELSSARATVVSRILQWKYGIPPENIIAVGVGQYKPIDNNEKDLKANRIAEIFIIPPYNN